MLAAFHREEVDYLPCSIYFNSNMSRFGYHARTPDSIIAFHESLGVDPVVDLPHIVAPPHPDVRSRVWLEPAAGEGPAVLYKEYQTPAGKLRVGMRHTQAWPFGQEVPFPGDDFCASHIHEPLVKGPEDVEAFELLHRPPGAADVDRHRRRIEEIRSAARKHGVAVRGLAGQGLATLMFQMGAQNLVYFAMDHPEAFARLARCDSDVNVRAVALLADLGVDFLKRFGGYEQTNFFSPRIFQTVVAPLLRQEVQAAHGVGRPIYYRVVSGTRPLLPTIAEAGFDCVEGFEPLLSDTTNQDIREHFGGRACIWTGVSSPGHIGGEGEEGVRQAVREAIGTFGRRGFILGVTNSIRAHWKWEHTLALIDEWKRLR